MTTRRLAKVLAGAILLLAPLLALTPWRSKQAGGDPVILPPQTITQTTTVPVMGYVLDPPGANYTPAVTWQQAVATAQAEEDTSSATSIQPTLALFTDPGEVPVTDERVTDPAVTGPPLTVQIPAWLVTINGVCIPDYAPTQPTVSCRAANATVVVNADTGDLIQEYSYN